MKAFLQTLSSKCTRLLFSQLFCMPMTWTLYRRHVKKLNWFHLSCLCRLLCICWWNRVPDTEVHNCAELSSIHPYLCKAKLCWAGHVLRMDDEYLPKHLLFGELIEGKRSVGVRRSALRALQRPLSKTSPLILMWENLASDRASWQNAMHHGAASYERK